AKGAGTGLSKIGDITKGLKGISNIDIPKLPDGSVQLPDGRFLEPNGNLVAPNGVVETTPIPHDTVPGTSGLPSSWQVQQPVPVGVHAGSGFPDMAAHTPGGGFDNVPYGPGSQVPGGVPNHVPNGSFGPAPAHFDPASHLPGGAPGHVPGNVGAHVPTDHFPAGAGNDIPGGNPHTPSTPDAPHTPHSPDAPHTPGHDGPGTHGNDGSHGGGHDNSHGGHADDAAAHADDAAHAGDHGGPGSHVDPHGAADDLAHGADDATGPGHHGGDGVGNGGAGDGFTYAPHISADDFDDLTTAEKHRVAAAELADGTVPFADDTAAIKYGQDYWNDYVDNLDPSAKQALWDYTGETFPSYHDMNGHLRGTPGFGPKPEVLHDIAEMDRVMSTRPVPDDIMVVRGTGLGHLKLDSPLDMLGKTYPDKGYTSTSLGNHPVSGFAGKEAILHLRVPKGTPALWLEKVSKFDVSERELLLARGSEFKVTRVFMENGQVQVYGEVLPPNKGVVHE
ncbi:ADP-ribosyltransferase, partial [Streptomyces sp. NPDC024089]|uniref:ADP-ribosyltransferase n=1 Tax=Streptomyces sp. NPDC024089 TaxID=3154328 RepID=UPI0033E38635